MKLTKIFHQKCILHNIEPTQKETIINQLVQVLVEADHFKASQKGNVVKSILERERLGSTGIGEGVAIPHAKLKFIDKFFGAIGIVPEGIDWRATDGNPVRFVFLFGSPENLPEEHIQLIKSIVQFIRLPHFIKFLGETSSAKEVYDLIKEGETQIK